MRSFHRANATKTEGAKRFGLMVAGAVVLRGLDLLLRRVLRQPTETDATCYPVAIYGVERATSSSFPRGSSMSALHQPATERSGSWRVGSCAAAPASAA